VKTCCHDDRFKDVFGCVNGCLACELEHVQTLNNGLVGRLGAIAEAFHNCVNKMKVRCPRCGAAYDIAEETCHA
jgi:hypothetical protein